MSVKISYATALELVKAGAWTQEAVNKNIEKGLVSKPRNVATKEQKEFKEKFEKLINGDIKNIQGDVVKPVLRWQKTVETVDVVETVVDSK
tara:strand:- start:318 stop:590 length:273 start_codon:yes stop_codon:yes gene_type:complete